MFPRSLGDDLIKIAGSTKRYNTLDVVKAEINKRLDSKVGEEILVVEQDFYPGRDSGCVREFSHVKRNLKLGVLTGLPAYKDNSLVLPSEKYVINGREDDELPRYKDWRLKNGNIKVGIEYLLGLDQDLNAGFRDVPTGCFGRERRYLGGYNHGLLLFSGSKVSDYFRYSGTEFDKIRKNKVLDLGYVDALRLLGREIPQDFLEKHNIVLHDKRIETISELEKMMFKLNNLRHEADTIVNRMTKERGYEYERGDGMIVLIEYTKDQISQSKRMKDKLVSEKIKEIETMLNESIKKGVLVEGLKVKLGTPGKSLDTTEFIDGIYQAIGKR